ncbi:MAG: DUF1576 domain-containing protein [Eubacteriales bacterium]|nr:DUF1576 domain-containing protein [Eubacteriales bacterium]
MDTRRNSWIINGIALGFSLFFLLSAFTAAVYTGEWGMVLADWHRILVTPCPLVTDYFAVGGLASAMLNAGLCGMLCVFFMVLLKGPSRANTLAGYFLVVAHCFYGLNLLNMLPCFLAPFLYLRLKRLNFKSNLHICMFATSFAPFISEFLFRYTIPDTFVFGEIHLTLKGIALAAGFCLVLGFIIPAILPGAHAWHKGYNLYNGGLAFGIFGFFIYNLMYRTLSITPPDAIEVSNAIYEQFGHSYRLYGNCFYIIVFALCFLAGYLLNGRSLSGLSLLFTDTGFHSDFSEKYGMPVCLMNIGLYGCMFLMYLNLVILTTNGAGFTGPTFGIMLAAMTFAAMGQHPRNVLPILIGYQLLYLFTVFCCSANGRELTWSLSTQAYLNGVAFATGMSPLVGRYGIRIGVVAGFMCASMCTATSALHGGFVLYNGGFTTGTTVLILLPILEHYLPDTRERMKDQRMNMLELISIVPQVPSNQHVGEMTDTDPIEVNLSDFDPFD